MTDRELTGDEAQRALQEAVRRTRATVGASDLRQREGDQPLPTVNDLPCVQDMVIADIEARKALGKQRYGTVLQPFNGRNALRDAYEESVDLAVYLRQCLYEAAAPSPLAPPASVATGAGPDLLFALAEQAAEHLASSLPIAAALEAALQQPATSVRYDKGTGTPYCDVTKDLIGDTLNVFTALQVIVSHVADLVSRPVPASSPDGENGHAPSAPVPLPDAPTREDIDGTILNQKAVPLPDAAPSPDFKALYFELLLAVGNKHPGESRHETVLRYIQQAEAPLTSTASSVSLASPPAKETTTPADVVRQAIGQEAATELADAVLDEEAGRVAPPSGAQKDE